MRPTARRRPLAALPLLLAALLAPLAASAQSNPGAIIDRAPQNPPAVPGAEDPVRPAAPAPGAGSDEGTQRIVEPRSRPFVLTAAFDQQVAFTDNVFLVDSGYTEALVGTTTLSARLDTLPVALGEGRFTASASALYQRAWHGLGDRTDPAVVDLDFNYFAVPLVASYRWGRGWEAYAGLSYAQIYSASGFERIYSDLSPSVGLRKLVPLARDRFLALGVGSAYHITDATVNALVPFREDRNDKVDLSADAALHLVRGPWVLAPSLRLAYTDYLHWEEGFNNAQDREDLSLNAGVSLAYNFSPRASARLALSHDTRWSDSLVNYDYQAAGVSAGLTLSIRY